MEHVTIHAARRAQALAVHALGSLLVTSLLAACSWACPFCTVTSQTLSEELETLDAAVIARLVRLPEEATAHTLSADVPQGVFEIRDVLKGAAKLQATGELRTMLVGQEQVGDAFLIMGVGTQEIDWSAPTKVSPRAIDYLQHLAGLPEKGPERLTFFQDYLEDADDLLARDAYDEFARSPYSDVEALRDRMDHDRLVSWIENPETALNRKRLYLIMLSVCGGAADLPMLERVLRNEDRKVRAGLDAAIGCYLLLAGSEGLALVEELFLENRQAESADTYAAIMALRFLGTETEAIPRARLLQSLHALLDRPALADLIIPDLVRWEDWSQIDRMVKLFQEADQDTSWVRAPIINFLRACPQPEAKQHLAELAKLDPAAVQQAETFFAFGGDGSPPAELAVAAGSDPLSGESGNAPPSAAETPAEQALDAEAAEQALASATRLPVLHRTASTPLNSLAYLVVVWLAGGMFFVVQWAILAGVGRGR